MYSAYQLELQWRAELLFAGRYDDLARHYLLPLPVTLGSLALEVTSREELALHLRRHHVALLKRGVTGYRPHVVAVELPKPLHRVWVEWAELGPVERSLRSSSVVYSFARREGGPFLSAMDYTRLSMPEFADARTHRRLIVA